MTMRSDDIVRKVTEHLDRGGAVQLLVDKAGRRYVKVVRWWIFSTKFEISGATESAIKSLLLKRR